MTTKNILKLITIIGLFSPFIAQSQIIKNPPKVGENFTVQIVASETLNEGNAGTNQVWDFSQISDSSESNTISYIDPTNTPYFSYFPESNLGFVSINNGDTTFSYNELNSNNELISWGAANQQIFARFEDPSIDFKYPAKYHDEFKDTFYTNTQSSFINYGTNTFSVDGSGILKLPDGNHTVLRVKSINNQTIDYQNGIVLYMNSTSYYYYDSIQSSPLFKISYINVSDSDQTNLSGKSAVYIKQNLASINFYPSNHTINVYPNPTNDIVEVSGVQYFQNTEYEIKNIQGKIVKNGMFFNSNKLDIKELIEGVYFLQLKDNLSGEIFIRKIVKTN